MLINFTMHDQFRLAQTKGTRSGRLMAFLAAINIAQKNRRGTKHLFEATASPARA